MIGDQDSILEAARIRSVGDDVEAVRALGARITSADLASASWPITTGGRMQARILDRLGHYVTGLVIAAWFACTLLVVSAVLVWSWHVVAGVL